MGRIEEPQVGVVGFAGSTLSLLISKPLAKWSTGAHVIATLHDTIERWLVDAVTQLASRDRRDLFSPVSAALGLPATTLASLSLMFAVMLRLQFSLLVDLSGTLLTSLVELRMDPLV